jgi:Mrp family chromosome partitioning ATPase
MLTYAEPLTLAKLVDGVVVVALEGRTRDDDITRLAERLKGANATVLGAAYLHRS